MPVGPLRLLDMVSLDVHHNVQSFLASELGDGYKVSPLTKQMVRAGMLGVSSRKDFTITRRAEILIGWHPNKSLL